MLKTVSITSNNVIISYLQIRDWKFVVDTEAARLCGIVQGVPGLLAGLVPRGTYYPVFRHFHHWNNTRFIKEFN